MAIFFANWLDIITASLSIPACTIFFSSLKIPLALIEASGDGGEMDQDGVRLCWRNCATWCLVMVVDRIRTCRDVNYTLVRPPCCLLSYCVVTNKLCAATKLQTVGSVVWASQIKIIQYSTTLLPRVNTIAIGMFCGAKYTHHTFTPIIKHH